MLPHALLLALLSANGVPQNGFPSWNERTILVLTNRARADPVAALSSCAGSGCQDAICYTASQPLVWDYDLNRSARFHMTNLVDASAPLQHPSPCVLATNIATVYPSSCDGSTSCACANRVSACGCGGCSCDTSSASCVTQPFQRIQMFNPLGCAENIAAGYADPEASLIGWLTEACSWNNSCGFQTCTSGENGHRYNILDPNSQILGAGSVPSSTTACVTNGEWDSQDFGCGANPTIPKLVAGTNNPQAGSATTFYANWYDTAPPATAVVNVDGTCNAMTVDRGSGGNATYSWHGSIGSGCRSYVFVFTDSQGATVQLPEVGAYLAGDGCNGDYQATAPSGCGVVSTNTTGTSSGGATTTGSTTSSPTAGGASTSGGGTTGGGIGGAGIGTAGGSIGGLSDVNGSGSGNGNAGSGSGGSKGGGCSSAGSNGGGSLLALILGAVAVLARRRRS